MKVLSPKNTILAQIPLSPARKRVKSVSGAGGAVVTNTTPQKMKRSKFEIRLKNLLSRTEFSDIFYEKTVIDIHHIIVVNWKIFEYEILERNGLWGRSRRFSTFNREVIVQGYQKVKFQSSEFSQKVLIYLRSVESEPDILRSHIPCFIPAAEIRKKQASLNTDSRFRVNLESRNQKRTRTCNTDNSTTKSVSKKSTTTTDSPFPIENISDNSSLGMTQESDLTPCSLELTIDQSKINKEILKPSRKRKISEISSPDKIHSSMYLDRLKFVATQKVVESLVDEHIQSLLEMVLNDSDTIRVDDRNKDDILLWNPAMMYEKQVVRYLKEWTNFSDLKRSEDVGHSLQTMNTRQPDIETALSQLSESEYNVEKALQKQKLGKYTIFVNEDDINQDTETGRITDSGPKQLIQFKHRQSKITDLRSWTAKMKLNFEKGLILFGEDVNKILKHFQCFEHLKPIQLDLYFYSGERQEFISSPESSKKIVHILDRTPLKHLQRIEFFELGKDWAKMRQNIFSSSSESDDSVYIEVKQTNKFGRTIKTMQQKKKRPKRLPDRFTNFQM